MTRYEEFYKKISLFEIATIKQFPTSRKTNRHNHITGVKFRDAYAETLEKNHVFEDIDWNHDPYSGYAILKTAPPKKLIVNGENVEFEGESSLTVGNWQDFLMSFQQVRNNVVHGAKLLQNMNLEDRDQELMSACLSFIKFMEDQAFVGNLY